MTPETPPSPESINFMGPLLQTLFFIFLFIGFIMTATFFIRRWGQMRWNKENVTSDIEVLERRALSPKSAVYLIKVKGKQILVGETANGLVSLAQFYENK
jgi:flagellar biosynthetic protein FliO